MSKTQQENLSKCWPLFGLRHPQVQVQTTRNSVHAADVDTDDANGRRKDELLRAKIHSCHHSHCLQTSGRRGESIGLIKSLFGSAYSILVNLPRLRLHLSSIVLKKPTSPFWISSGRRKWSSVCNIHLGIWHKDLFYTSTFCCFPLPYADILWKCSHLTLWEKLICVENIWRSSEKSAT